MGCISRSGNARLSSHLQRVRVLLEEHPLLPCLLEAQSLLEVPADGGLRLVLGPDAPRLCNSKITPRRRKGEFFKQPSYPTYR